RIEGDRPRGWPSWQRFWRFDGVARRLAGQIQAIFSKYLHVESGIGFDRDHFAKGCGSAVN
ncbi:hypothetical protein SB758_34025, partial [Burkholderia sp. SIMBA_013]